LRRGANKESIIKESFIHTSKRSIARQHTAVRAEQGQKADTPAQGGGGLS